MEPGGALKTVVSSVSHLFYCLSLLAIAGIEWRFHQDLSLPPWLAMVTGYLLAAATVCLLVWSAVDGFRTLVRGRQWMAAILLGGIYLSVILLAIHAFPALVLRR